MTPCRAVFALSEHFSLNVKTKTYTHRQFAILAAPLCDETRRLCVNSTYLRPLEGDTQARTILRTSQDGTERTAAEVRSG